MSAGKARPSGKGKTKLPELVTASNPFVGHGPGDTISQVRKGLDVFSQLNRDPAACAMSDDLQFGQFLILQTMVLALEAAEQQMEIAWKRAQAEATPAPVGGEP